MHKIRNSNQKAKSGVMEEIGSGFWKMLNTLLALSRVSPRIPDVGPRTSFNLDRFVGPDEREGEPLQLIDWAWQPLQLAPGHIDPKIRRSSTSFAPRRLSPAVCSFAPSLDSVICEGLLLTLCVPISPFF